MCKGNRRDGKPPSMFERGLGSRCQLQWRFSQRISSCSAADVFLLAGFRPTSERIRSVGKLKPALRHRYQKFAVRWIARLARQGQTLGRALAISLAAFHHRLTLAQGVTPRSG